MKIDEFNMLEPEAQEIESPTIDKVTFEDYINGIIELELKVLTDDPERTVNCNGAIFMLKKILWDYGMQERKHPDYRPLPDNVVYFNNTVPHLER